MARVGVQDLSHQIWNEISKRVKKAIVFIDNESAEILHWNGGLARLARSGILSAGEFSSFEAADVSIKKAVFLLTGPVVGLKVNERKKQIMRSWLTFLVSRLIFLERLSGIQSSSTSR